MIVTVYHRGYGLYMAGVWTAYIIHVPPFICPDPGVEPSFKLNGSNSAADSGPPRAGPSNTIRGILYEGTVDMAWYRIW